MIPFDENHIYIKSRKEWDRWLNKNHSLSNNVWLIFDKGKTSELSYDDIVEVALCYGWIDSKAGSVDETRTKLYISKRRSKSNWSNSNMQRVEKLKKLELIKPAGLKVILDAQKYGNWPIK